MANAEDQDKTEEEILKCVDLMSTLPPKDAEKNLFRLAYCIPKAVRDDYEEKLFQKVDFPLKVKTDDSNGKDFVAGEYNRDGDSHRSPWSNKFFPEMEEGLKPSNELRKLENELNMIFDLYRDQYYHKKGVSSVFAFSLGNSDANKFGITCTVRKELVASAKSKDTGEWNSTHVISCTKENDSKFSYQCISSLLISIDVGDKNLGTCTLSGTVQDENTQSCSFDKKDWIQSHVTNIGKLVEEQETKLLGQIGTIYFGKCDHILQHLRHINADVSNQRDKMANLANLIGKGKN